MAPIIMLMSLFTSFFIEPDNIIEFVHHLWLMEIKVNKMDFLFIRTNMKSKKKNSP